MNKPELIAQVAKKASITKKEATAVVDATFAVISDALVKGEKVPIAGFGTFEVRTRAAREGRNPITGAVIQVAASKAPAFKPGQALKQAVK